MEKIRPFSSGSEFEDWYTNNCEGCSISTVHNETDVFICHIEKELINGLFGDGKINKTIAEKVGFKQGFFKNCHFKNMITFKPIKLNLSVFSCQQLTLF